MGTTMKSLNKVICIGMLILFSCNRGAKINVNQVMNHNPIDRAKYKKDSINLIILLKEDLKNHKGFFYSKEFFDSTQVIIDSIIYSPNFQKMAVFVVTKNPTFRQLLPDKRSDFYYNGNCYLGLRKHNSILLFSGGPSFSNSINKTELTEMMRSTYFSIYSKIRDVNGEYKYKYNLGDVGFWSCPIWDEMKNKVLKKEAFEKEKKENPSNIYDNK